MALENDVGIGAEFEDDLTARATWGAGRVLAVEDGDSANAERRALGGNAGRDGGAFGADGQAVRGIFDVATYIDIAGAGE